MSWLQWVTSTIAVLALILLLGRMARWMLERGSFESGPATQVGSWRVAPDARVRAVRVLDEVHLLLENRRDTTLLQSLSHEDFEKQRAESAPSSDSPMLRLFPGRARQARSSRPVAGR